LAKGKGENIHLRKPLCLTAFASREENETIFSHKLGFSVSVKPILARERAGNLARLFSRMWQNEKKLKFRLTYVVTSAKAAVHTENSTATKSQNGKLERQAAGDPTVSRNGEMA
jgi:hypothetical protein